MVSTEWYRVTRDNPCPICGHDHWCCILADGTGILCMRSRSQYPRPNGGWFHRINNTTAMAQPVVRHTVKRKSDGLPNSINWQALNVCYQSAIRPALLAEECQSLGISVKTWRAFGVGWDGEAWTMPMYDGDGRMIGIHRRTKPQKCCVHGSHLGLFVPSGLNGCDMLLAPEGASDAACLLDLGYAVVGRPNSSARGNWLIAWCQAHGVKQLVLVADNDEAGQRGAADIYLQAVGANLQCHVVSPPATCKDARSARLDRKSWDRIIGQSGRRESDPR